jgi:hypothetical protein
MSKKILESAQVVEPTLANAARLWRWYEEVFVTDQELLARTCRSDLGIDGVTEELNVDDFYHALHMPDTLALEVVPANEGQGGGFVIVRYSNRDDDSRARFKEYFFKDVFPIDALQFRSSEDRMDFLRGVDRGQVCYLAEFVSRGGRKVSTALIQAAFEIVCRGRSRGPFTVFGKCLDAVQIGHCKNSRGNRPVKALAESLGLRKLAWCNQVRPIHLSDQLDLRVYGFPKPTASIRLFDAVLTFALYVGDATRALECLSASRLRT